MERRRPIKTPWSRTGSSSGSLPPVRTSTNSICYVGHISTSESLTHFANQSAQEDQPSLTGDSSYSGKTATSSPFASGLTTPNDEEPRPSLFSPAIEDQTPKQLGGFESQQPFQKHTRRGPLFRAVFKAREAAKSVFETPRRLKKVWQT